MWTYAMPDVNGPLLVYAVPLDKMLPPWINLG